MYEICFGTDLWRRWGLVLNRVVLPAGVDGGVWGSVRLLVLMRRASTLVLFLQFFRCLGMCTWPR